MRWEANELVIVWSVRRKLKARVSQECVVCKQEILKGERCSSFGVVDRNHKTRERWYTCVEHSHVFDFSSVEDCPEWQQRFLYDNRIASEVWFPE